MTTDFIPDEQRSTKMLTIEADFVQIYYDFDIDELG